MASAPVAIALAVSLATMVTVVHAAPSPLPARMLWRLTLIEHHAAVRPGAVDFAFGNYYFDWTGPLVASRQENAVSYQPWRAVNGSDIPWNTFWAFNGTVAAA